MAQASRRTALTEFLRERRAALSPEDVGLPSVARRRTPGLRREDVAELAGISLNWYGLLESGAPIRVSHQTLDRIALALRLDRASRRRLIALAVPELDLETAADPLDDLVARLFARRAEIEAALDAGMPLQLEVSGNAGSLTYARAVPGRELAASVARTHS